MKNKFLQNFMALLFPPHWYGITLAAIALPCAWTGGKLFELKNKTVYHG
jgi:hypothetical protein